MEPFTKTLIECYAKYAVENVDQCKEYKTLCNENKDDTLFNKERERIERLKRDIEKEVDQKSSTSSDQIINALKLLNKKFSRKGSPKSKEDVEYIYKLILKTYSSHWREDQKDYFKNVYKAITTYMDYFLSFTKRKSTPNLKNIVNSHHMYFIRAILHWSEEKFEKENEKDKNLLAEAINYLLRSHKQQLRGFYYPEHEHDNQKVKEKLRDASGKTFAFVQIIQNVMLSKSFPCEPNYCFFEYCEAKRNISDDKRLFILAEGSRKDTIANGDYWENFDTWYNEIKGKDQLILEHTEDSYNIARLRRVIKKNLLDKVSETKRKMINEVPP